jgi:RHS repeat-associated protein
VDALNQATTITRDLLGRPTSITQADGRSTTLRYDLTGTTYNATGFPNASKGALSEIADTTDITKYQRDGLGRVIRKTQQLTPFTAIGGVSAAPSRSVQYAYVTATAALSVPGAGQLARLTYPNNNQLNYLYTPAGQISQLNWGTQASSYPLLTSITYTPLGQPSSWNWEFADANATTNLPASRTYDTAGRVIQTELGTYTYDAAGRITSMSQQLYMPANSNPASTAVTATTVQYTVGYDALGRITTFTQLPSATVGTGTTSISLAGKQASFTYDANGNRLSSIQITGTGTGAVTTSRSYSVQAAGNRLLGFSQTITAGTATAGASTSVAHTYDANGSLINDGLRSYEFDAGNRLAASTVGATDASPTTRYVHNTLGQRLFKTEPLFPPAPGDETDPTFMASLIAFFTSLWGPAPTATEKLGFTYYYDEAGSLISEMGSGGAQSTGNTQYVYLPTPGGPMPVAAVVTNKHYAVHSDHLNTPRRLTQSDKKVAWQWAYSAFGDEQPVTARNRFVDPSTGNLGSTTVADVTFNVRYPGQYFDKESGLHYNLMRSYQANLGRYTQSDPIDLKGGWNRFGYVGGNPLVSSDPDGLQMLCTGSGLMIYCRSPSNPFMPGFEPGMPVDTPATPLPTFTLPKPPIVTVIEIIISTVINACPSSESAACVKERERAVEYCERLYGGGYLPDRAGKRIGGKKFDQCVEGQISEACGGNKVE